ncbi:MAG: phosphoglycerate kinase [Pseudomonadota bacterium]
MRTLDDIDPTGKTVLVRIDLNVPMQDGEVADATRIDRIVPTLVELLGMDARVVAMSHFGRPKGKRQKAMSLEPLCAPLGAAMGGVEVVFASDCIGPSARAAVDALEPGAVLLLENLRFHPGEEANEPDFAEQLASLADLYVGDAFSAAHRAHASVVGVAERLPSAAGRLMQAEIEALTKVLEKPIPPVVAVIGGAKVSTKIDLLDNLIGKVDAMILGGGMANTFLFAQGTPVGKSLCEADMADTARKIMARAKSMFCDILLPVDAQIAKELTLEAKAGETPIELVPEDAMILDIGPATIEMFCDRIGESGTVLWNGPLGAFELPPFDVGTNEVAKVVGELSKDGLVMSVAGGGDTIAALAHAGVLDQISYVSTAGGAFLEWLEGKVLPGVEVLQKD